MNPLPLGSKTHSRIDLLRAIQQDPALAAILDEVQNRLKGQPADPGHDQAHFLRVAYWALKLAEGEVSPRLIIAAALLHDVVNVPKDSPDRHRASELSAEVAKGLLPNLGFSPQDTKEIADAVRDHSFSRGARPETLLGKVLQDADRLEALGTLGVFRTISTGTKMGGTYFDSEDPWAASRELDDRRFSVDHFFIKLFKLPELMNTEAGRREASRRAETMRICLERLGEELGEEFPMERCPAPIRPKGC